MKICAISIDLDEIYAYRSIHGMGAATVRRGPVYSVALGRLAEWSRAVSVPVTCFAVASDLDDSDNVAALRALLETGNELANHSQDHLYDLTRRSRAEMREQVAAASVVLGRLAGARELGFRAPGYTITDELFDVLREVGVLYDSSVFPCPPYFTAKAAALLAMKWRGRPSRSILDSPSVLRAPLRPYRIGTPYWTRGSGLLELPIQVATPLRLPFIGTSLSLLGPGGARALAATLVGEELINLELHGIDFLDQNDGLADLARHQPDVSIPFERKLATFGAVVELLRARGYAFVRLDEAARAF